MQTETIRRSDSLLWTETLETIEQAVGAQTTRLWLANSVLTVVEAADGAQTYQVGLPNLFIQEWVQAHFKRPIETALGERTGRVAKVAFSVDASLFNRSREAQKRSEKALAKSPSPRAGGRSGLNRHTTFSAFVVAPSNHLAYQAARDAVADLGNQYNPLVLYGAEGLGKTHLLQAVLRQARADRPGLRSLYVSADQFATQFVLSMKSGTLSRFRERFRRLHLLIVDDIQRLAKKSSTQSELLYTLNELENAGSQVVFSSDRHPKQLSNLRRSLVNRFVSGMVVRLDPPAEAARIQILKTKAAAAKRRLDPKVVERIARRVTQGGRALEAALTRVIAFEAVSGQRVTPHMVPQILDDDEGETGRPVSLQEIDRSVCAAFGASSAMLKARSRKRSVVLPRQIAMTLSRELTGESLGAIGHYWGDRNHTTVLFAIRQVTEAAKQDGEIRRILKSLRRAIGERVDTGGNGPETA